MGKHILIACVLAFSLVLFIACGGDDSGKVAELEKQIEALEAQLAGGAEGDATKPVGWGSRLDVIRERGKVLCADNTASAMWGWLDENGKNVGYGPDWCKAYAAMIFGDAKEEHWEIVNISAGGYCLRWNSDDTSKAQIGELISLQEFDANSNFEWRIGVIRWMQFTPENGLEIGVQVISPKVTTANAQRVNRPKEAPFDCLMLPGIKALQQPPSTILPSHAFKPGDKLVVQIMENKLDITLGETKEHTGSFTQFSYNNTETDQRIKKQAKKEEASKKRDDFDELWSSL